MLAEVTVTLWQLLLDLCAAAGLLGGPCHLYNRDTPLSGFDYPLRLDHLTSLPFDPKWDLQAGL